MSVADQLARFFRPGGALEQAHPGHEWRPQQALMAEQVLETAREGGHLVVEAGTGVGKTLAYLVPALLASKRVIVSTGTKALQDQIAGKDVPFLRERCGMRFDATVVKGRDNYLCRHRFEDAERAPELFPEARTPAWASVREWARRTMTGDVAELTDLPENPPFWPEVSARADTCLGTKCALHDDCFLQEVRRAARNARLVIVNHHLYLADAAVRAASDFGSILPDADLVVFDEAHRLETAATSFFGRVVSNWRLRELADDARREMSKARVESAGVLARVDRLAVAAAAFAKAWGAEGRTPLDAVLSREQEGALREARASVEALGRALDAVPGRPDAFEPLSRRVEDLVADVDELIHRADATSVYWSEVRGRGAFVASSPVEVARLLHDHVFAPLRASVLCSATLAVGGALTHARARLGLGPAPPPPRRPRSRLHDEDDDVPVIDVRADLAEAEAPPELPPLVVREAVHASPFDYASQGLLYVPRRMPDPRDRGWAIACAQESSRLVSASRGRAFLLFTSHENLRRVHELLREELAAAGLTPLVQGEAPKLELLRRFREAPGAVLFATSSFWEGVDVQGEALSLVVIDKLPFAVPSDPIVAARSRLLQERGGDPFRDLAIPDAVIALKQGVGRLIRSRHDRGVVAVLDPRVRAAWGRRILDDLPPFRRTMSFDDVAAFFAER